MSESMFDKEEQELVREIRQIEEEAAKVKAPLKERVSQVQQLRSECQVERWIDKFSSQYGDAILMTVEEWLTKQGAYTAFLVSNGLTDEYFNENIDHLGSEITRASTPNSDGSLSLYFGNAGAGVTLETVLVVFKK